MLGAFRRYREYLQSLQQVFPPSAFALATSDWYFNPNDHRSPHDAWLERMEILEQPATDDVRRRSVSINLRLLGAYHDGHIELKYSRVFSYALNVRSERGHRDWRYDEFRVSPDGHLIHEIEWCGLRETGVWMIEASDIVFRWIPQRQIS